MIKYEDTCEVTCTDNGKTVPAEVMNFRAEDGLTIALATNKIVMKYNKRHNQYQGSMHGMEFTSPGPKYYDIRQGRQR